MKVRNMINAKGNPIANQFIITEGMTEVFQSYKSIIAKLHHGPVSTKVTLDKTYWDYSRTTGKYRNIFLGESRETTERKIKSGEYKLANLN